MPDADELRARIKAALTPLIGCATLADALEVAMRERAVWQLERDHFLTEEYARSLVEEARRAGHWDVRAAYERLQKGE
jgi:hypothetical protein